MVGFLDTQHLMSSNGLGAFAEDHSIVVLKDGSVIMGYMDFQSGRMNFHRYNPNTGATTFLSSTGAIGSGEKDASMMATADGGFSVVLITRAGPLLDDGRLTIRDYTKDGVLTGSKDLAEGFLENPEVTKVAGGYFISYRDRHNTDGIEYKGAFYNDNDVLLNTVNFDSGRILSPFPRAQPQTTLLSNGNIATTWLLSDKDGAFVQIFKPDGSPVGARKQIWAPTLVNEFLDPPEITADPAGGFVVVTHGSNNGNPLELSIQRFSNTGTKIGTTITLDTSLGQPNGFIKQPQVGFTKAGLMVVAWTAPDLSGVSGDTDTFLAMFSKNGNLIAGPLLGNASAPDDQDRVSLVNLKNGDLLFSFNDDTNVQFSFQASIQARLLVDPDTIWEGTAAANVKTGTAGNDVMLGLGGNDTLNGAAGEDYLKGGFGDDTVNGGDNGDALEGEDGNDTLDGGKGNDQVFGGAGADVVKGGTGNDQLFGNDGNDRIDGGTGSDTMVGGNGADTLLGGGGNDHMSDTSGKNTFKGGGGNDRMFGGTEIDIMFGQGGNDEMDGGAGRDRLVGGDGFDTLRGGDDNDVLRGGSGDDNINSGKGNDREYGDAGRDRLFDSDGDDKMWGGADGDSFIFIDTDFGHDVIKDFEFGLDVLDMGLAARAMGFAGLGDIVVTELAAGVRFKVDADNWVLVEGAKLSDFGPNDLILDSPF